MQPTELSSDGLDGLGQVLTEFVSAPAGEIDDLIDRSLIQLGLLLDLDLAAILLYDHEQGLHRITYQWCGSFLDHDSGIPGSIVDDSYPWLKTKLDANEWFFEPGDDEWPDQAQKELEACMQVNIKSAVWVPFDGGYQTRGYIACHATRRERTWDEPTVRRLRLYGQVIAGTLHRHKLHRALAEVRDFEALLTRISADFARLPHQEMDSGIDERLEAIGECLGLERVFLIEFADEKRNQEGRTQGWAAEGSVDDPEFYIEDFERKLPWVAAKFRKGEIFVCRDIETLPQEATRWKQYLRRIGVRSGILLPILVSDEVAGGLVIASCQVNPSWPDEPIQRLKLLAELFGNLLTRKQIHQEAEIRLRMERHLVGLSKVFIDARQEAIVNRIEAGLKSTGEVFGVDRCYIALFTEDTKKLAGSSNHPRHPHTL